MPRHQEAVLAHQGRVGGGLQPLGNSEPNPRKEWVGATVVPLYAQETEWNKSRSCTNKHCVPGMSYTIIFATRLSTGHDVVAHVCGHT